MGRVSVDMCQKPWWGAYLLDLARRCLGELGRNAVLAQVPDPEGSTLRADMLLDMRADGLGRRVVACVRPCHKHTNSLSRYISDRFACMHICHTYLAIFFIRHGNNGIGGNTFHAVDRAECSGKLWLPRLVPRSYLLLDVDGEEVLACEKQSAMARVWQRRADLPPRMMTSLDLPTMRT